MNSLSWLIYVAGIVDAINGALGASVVVLVIVGILKNVYSAHHNDFYDHKPKMAYTAKPFLIAVIIMLLSAPVPSKSTLYMIAASEMGERAVKSEMAGDLAEIIKKEIKKMKDAK